jgi:hypothetical protein
MISIIKYKYLIYLKKLARSLLTRGHRWSDWPIGTDKGRKSMFDRFESLPRIAAALVASVMFAGLMLGAAASILPVA